MDKFEVTLKNIKLKSYHQISWLIVFLNIIAEYTYIFLYPSTTGDTILVTGVLLLSVSFLVVQRNNKIIFRDKKDVIGVVYVFICFVWIKFGIYPAVAANIIFYLLYIYSIRKFEVQVDRNEIIYPSFPKKRIQWNELQNIILKDGILTIDFKNNKLFQNEIEDNDVINEKDFNDFCKEQLNK